ncbi:MAG: hypothetical protein V1892_00715 [bacterium]
MHDLLLAQEIYTIIKKEAKKNKFKEIIAVVIELGKILEHQERVTPKNLIYNLKLIDKNKKLEKTNFRVLPRNDNKWQLVEIVGN